MKIFPIGIIAAADSTATIDGVDYDMFEPNKNCVSNEIHNIIVSPYDKQYMLTRKKAEAHLTMKYYYDNIFDREYRQIEHFVDSVDDALDSFFAVDWNKGQTPSDVTASGGNWIVSIDNTRLYSSITNKKASRAFLWDAKNWKEGAVETVTTNTSITVDVDTDNYGDLTATAADSSVVYPLYEVRLAQNALSSFKTTFYVNEYINGSNDGGWMRTGEVEFISKYSL